MTWQPTDRTGKSCSVYTWSPHTERVGWGIRVRRGLEVEIDPFKDFCLPVCLLEWPAGNWNGCPSAGANIPFSGICSRTVAQRDHVGTALTRQLLRANMFAEVAKLDSCRDILVLLEPMPTGTKLEAETVCVINSYLNVLFQG